MRKGYDDVSLDLCEKKRWWPLELYHDNSSIDNVQQADFGYVQEMPLRSYKVDLLDALDTLTIL